MYKVSECMHELSHYKKLNLNTKVRRERDKDERKLYQDIKRHL